MKVGRDPDVHLTYCTNIHPGETWPELRANLEQHVVAVKSRVARDRPFGVGLRVSARAATELGDPRALAELQGLLDDNGLYVFTINGFPYGDFHATRVKECVYRPDWLEPERLDYSNALACLLANLLPDGVEGSVSTVPIAHTPRSPDRRSDGRAAEALVEHAVFLARLREATGRDVALALEPEPECRLETSAHAVAFFESELFSQHAVDRYTERTGASRGAAADSLRRHLGVCLDACHAAVEFEDPDEAVDRLQAAGIRLLKIQLSAGLTIDPVTPPLLAQLRPFADDVYLHQVVERSHGGYRRFADLPDALSAQPLDGVEWRIHFHVPLFFEMLGAFRSTRPFVEALLERQRAGAIATHFEIETYTWEVLPEEFRRDDVADAVAAEIRWVLARLTA